MVTGWRNPIENLPDRPGAELILRRVQSPGPIVHFMRLVMRLVEIDAGAILRATIQKIVGHVCSPHVLNHLLIQISVLFAEPARAASG